MSTAEGFREYPNPGALLQCRRHRRPKPQEMTAEQRRDGSGIFASIMQNTTFGPPPGSSADNREPRSRTVYSERQLQEVMSTFGKTILTLLLRQRSGAVVIPSYERDVLRKKCSRQFSRSSGWYGQPSGDAVFWTFRIGLAKRTARRQPPGRLQRRFRTAKLPPRARERIKKRQGLTDEQLDRVSSGQIRGEDQPDPSRPRGLTENYARELLELHTMVWTQGIRKRNRRGGACIHRLDHCRPRGYRRIAATK